MDLHASSSIAAVLLLAAPAVAQTVPSCEEIATITAAGTDGFKSWRGRYDSSLLEHESRYTLNGASYCVISVDDEGGSPEYQCQWDFASFDSAQSLTEALVAKVRACAAGNKTTERRRTGSTASGRRVDGVDFDFGYLQPKISVRRQEFRRNTGIIFEVSPHLRPEEAN